MLHHATEQQQRFWDTDEQGAQGPHRPASLLCCCSLSASAHLEKIPNQPLTQSDPRLPFISYICEFPPGISRVYIILRNLIALHVTKPPHQGCI